VTLTLGMLAGCSQVTATNAMLDYNFEEMAFPQLEAPDANLPQAVIKTSVGDFTVVLYPEYAPVTVQNFIDRANDGFYDGKNVFELRDECFVTGSWYSDGSGGATSDGQPIPNEYSEKLWPFRGALMSFYTRQGYGDSRFVVLNSAPFGETEAATMRGLTDDEGNRVVPEELIQAFLDNKCIAGFAGWYTIFGQTVEGFETIDKITGMAHDGNFKPVTPITIETVKIIMPYESEQ
jgi:peptidyl-prolyl cis-trans isomerase B (cyclophilin B)